MYHDFGLKVGSISHREWMQITAPCFLGANVISLKESKVMIFFAISGYMYLCSYPITKLVRSRTRRHCPHSCVTKRCHKLIQQYVPNNLLMIISLSAIPIFGLSQLWTILRIRIIQRQISLAAGNEYADAKWAFGQIVAITLFTPVLIQFYFDWWYTPCDTKALLTGSTGGSATAVPHDENEAPHTPQTMSD